MDEFKSSHKSSNGFTIPELLIVVSAIALLSSIVIAALMRARERAFVARMGSDFAQINRAVEAYRTQNSNSPCIDADMTSNDMTDTYEKGALVGYYTWPKTPFNNDYYLGYTGTPGNPSASNNYYIGIIMPSDIALIFDRLYDDGNLGTGLFKYNATPLPHYEYFLNYVITGDHC
ncbi:MAG TPA: type II secretion system protein [Candidatus Paceibacterota bacterium]|nr:type II secretion system protein [Candidatus Paceibacterota bacterium]